MNISKIGFVVSYYSPQYVRATTLRRAFGQIKNLQVYNAWNERKNLFRYFETFGKVLKIKKQENPRYWFINFRGHEYYWPLRLFLGRKSKTIFDEFVSPYDSFVNERKMTSPNSILAKLLFSIEKSILEDSDYLIVDTTSQAGYYADLFNIPQEKFFVVNISVDETIFSPEAIPQKYDYPEHFIVFTYATFLPLHGMEVIAKAAKQLIDLPVRFVIAGGKGKSLQNFLKFIKDNEIENIHHIDWIDYQNLPSYICGADLCLGGPFGDTPQAGRLITGKTLQFLACGKPTIIGKNSETGYFEDKMNCLLVKQDNENDLADAVRWAYDNPLKLQLISKLGKQTYDQRYSIRILTNQIRDVLQEIN